MNVPVNGLLIKPAGPDCNMACRYCFYAGREAFFPAAEHRMKPDTFERAAGQYLALAGEQASIGFQGGEPTLWGLPAFEQAAGTVDRLRKPGQRVSLWLQTNGLLLDGAWVDFLRRRGMLAGLSLDGDAALHDANRVDGAGGPTYNRVLAAARRLESSAVAFNTLTVVTQDAAARGRALYDALSGIGGGYMQFIPCLNGGGLSPSAQAYGDFLTDTFDAWYGDGQPRHYVRLFDELLVAYMEYRSPGCTFAPRCAANLVIEHDGSVYPCDFFVDPRWKLGSLDRDTLAGLAASPRMTEFLTLKALLPPECGSCPWLPLCRGGCPAYRAQGRPLLCAAYRRFFAYAHPRMLALKARLLARGGSDAARWRAFNATGRNDPCPCGSGEKMKRCCGPLKAL